MSEEKTIEHTKAALHLMKDKSRSLKEKFIGFIEEIFIIVLAVSITLMFHNWNDERHERAIERDFLKGTAEDLKQGATNLEGSIKSFQPTLDYYNTVWKQINDHKIDVRYVDSLGYNLMNTNYFVFDDSRFEGFKSSGYLRLIENKQLLKHLVNLYSVYMPFERETDVNVFHTREQDFDRYIGVKLNLDTSQNIRISPLLNDPAVRYQIFRYVVIFEERKRHKQDMIKRINALAKEIETELKE
jgi:hypothetical protein